MSALSRLKRDEVTVTSVCKCCISLVMDEHDFNVYGGTLSDISVVVTVTDYEKGPMSAPEKRNQKDKKKPVSASTPIMKTKENFYFLTLNWLILKAKIKTFITK